MAKLGIVAQYLHTRNDIREVIQRLAKMHHVVLYLRPTDLHTAPEGVEVRPITARKRTFRNEVLSRLFYLFGKIPRSRQNYFIVEHFKIGNTKTYRLFKIEKKILLFLSRFTPRWMSYDQYLNRLDYEDTTPVADVDRFFCFTEIYDDHFFRHLVDAGKPIAVFVYSWDHPCKMVRFSERVRQYLVWNEGLREDMIGLQGIDAGKVRVVGASQLSYIAEFKAREAQSQPPFSFEYFYFGCATGTPKLVKQEVQIIGQLAAVLLDVFPAMKLVVRPYPFLSAWHLYDPLRKYPNVYFDDAYRTSPAALALTREQIEEKFIKINFARAFLHIGTTMGYEATYFDTPVLQINFPVSVRGPLSLHGFIHQYQNDKYLLLRQFPNVINSAEDFRRKLPDIVGRAADFTAYNAHIARQTQLQNFDEFCGKLEKEIMYEGLQLV